MPSFRVISVLALCFALAIFVIYYEKTGIAPSSSLDKILAQKRLIVCAESGYLPLEMKTASNEWLGFDPDMMAAYAETLKVKLEIQDTKWDGIIPSLLTDKCDMIASSMAMTDERRKVVAFSDPYYDNHLLIATKDTVENRKNFKTLADFNKANVMVAVKTGTSTDLYLQNSHALANAQIMRFDADADTVNAVLQGRSHAFIYDTPYVKLAVLSNPGKLYVIPQGFQGDQFAVAMRQGDDSLLKNFNNFLAQWKKSGEYAKVLKYYFEGQDWKTRLNK